MRRRSPCRAARVPTPAVHTPALSSHADWKIRHAIIIIHEVRAFFLSILGYFLSPPGIVLMGILDASMVFFLPLGIDFVVILMSARKPDLFWLYALLATTGSVIGAAGTFWIGKKAGEAG